MPQFLIHPSAIKEGIATITGTDARHITTVLRLKKGDWLVLTDGSGRRWRSEIIEASPKLVVAKLALQIGRASSATTDSPIVLAQALIKHDRFEWIIQKSVELGCERIIPFTSERTIPKFGSGKLQRWQKIADEAAKQCGTAIRPVVEQPLNYLELLERSKQFGRTIMFYEGEESLVVAKLALPDLSRAKLALPDLSRASSATTNANCQRMLLIIGPEGGFAASEVETAKKAGAITCSLGPLILRVETAAIAALTLVQYKLGYFDEVPVK